MRTSTSHEEGCERLWSVLTKEFCGSEGKVTQLKGVEVDWHKDDNDRWQMSERKGTEFEIKADLILLAMGFVHPVHTGLVKELGVTLDGRGNVQADHNATSLDGVFTAGDANSGASLVVRAIDEGRHAAEAVHTWLMK